VLLIKLGLPTQGSLALTGSLLRFLPGAALVSGMHDLIDGALMSGTARLAEVALLGAAIAGAASLVLAFGAGLGVRLQITSAGRVDWPALVLVAAGFVAVAFYACSLGVPRRALLSAATLGAIAVVLTRGLTPLSADLSRSARTLLAALVIGIVGTRLAHRSQAPAALWMVPAILPLLPAPSTLLPALAQTEPAHKALQGLAAETAFLIGVGVASGSILVETFQRYCARALQPVVGMVSDGLSAPIVRPIRTWGRRKWRRANPAADGNDAEHGRPPG
jgi:uncharacterized membrane protein YjjB (DUF3815 family)